MRTFLAIVATTFSTASLLGAEGPNAAPTFLKGVAAFEVTPVVFNPEAQVQLKSTTEQFRSKVEDALNGTPGLKAGRAAADAKVTVSVNLDKQEFTVDVPVPGTTTILKAKVTLWVYTVDTYVTQTVSVNRANLANPVTGEARTWRLITTGIISTKLDERLLEVVIKDQIPLLIRDWGAAQK